MEVTVAARENLSLSGRAPVELRSTGFVINIAQRV